MSFVACGKNYPYFFYAYNFYFNFLLIKEAYEVAVIDFTKPKSAEVMLFYFGMIRLKNVGISVVNF
jgi:hypothetical protein